MSENLNKVLDVKNKDNKPKKHKLTGKLRALVAGLLLATVATVCVNLILFTNDATKKVIAKNQSNSIKEQLKNLLPPAALKDDVKIECYQIKENRHIGHNQKIFVARNAKGNLGYVLTYATSLGYSNPLVLISGFTSDGRVYKTDIQFSQETPGLGDKVDRKHGNFLDQFNGKSLNDATWDVKKYGGDFDFITGATVTSRATVIATSEALKALDKINLRTLKKCKGL